MQGVQEAILPTHDGEVAPAAPPAAEDEAHAPGHRRRGPAPDQPDLDSRARSRSRYLPGRGQRTPDR